MCVCLCEIPPPPPFLLTSLYICIRCLNTTGPMLPLSCALRVCIFDSTLCKRLLKPTHASSETVPSPLQMWRRALTKRDGCILDLNVFGFGFFLSALSHYAVFLLNFGVKIHQGDKRNPFQKEKKRKNEPKLRGGFLATPRSEAERLLWKRLAEDGGEWHCYCVKLWLFKFCIAHLF